MKKFPPTGLASIYVMHSPGFHGRLRPAHDAAANVQCYMTESETRTLRCMIARYAEKCAGRRLKETKAGRPIAQVQS